MDQGLQPMPSLSPVSLIFAAARSPARILGPTNAYLAATVATCFRGPASDKLVTDLRESALTFKNDLDGAGTIPKAERIELIRRARRLQESVQKLPQDSQVPVLATIVRELLNDAPDAALVLDRAVRKACDDRYHPTPEHAAVAAKLLETV